MVMGICGVVVMLYPQAMGPPHRKELEPSSGHDLSGGCGHTVSQAIILAYYFTLKLEQLLLCKEIECTHANITVPLNCESAHAKGQRQGSRKMKLLGGAQLCFVMSEQTEHYIAN